METRNYHRVRQSGRLSASGGTMTEVVCILRTYEGKLGLRSRPIWERFIDVEELDFRSSKLPESTIKKKGRMTLKLKDGNDLFIEWRDGAWCAWYSSETEDGWPRRRRTR